MAPREERRWQGKAPEEAGGVRTGAQGWGLGLGGETEPPSGRAGAGGVEALQTALSGV